MSEFADRTAPVAPQRVATIGYVFTDVSDELFMRLVSDPTPLELQKYELNWIPRTTASLKSSMRKWQDCNFMHSVRSFHLCDISGLLREVSRVRGSPRTKKPS